jgi:hypothetical protein
LIMSFEAQKFSILMNDPNKGWQQVYERANPTVPCCKIRIIIVSAHKGESVYVTGSNKHLLNLAIITVISRLVKRLLMTCVKWSHSFLPAPLCLSLDHITKAFEWLRCIQGFLILWCGVGMGVQDSESS